MSVSAVAEYLPKESQLVAYLDLGGVAQVVKRLGGGEGGGPAEAFADLPACPPIGAAAYVYEGGAEGYLVITADTLKAIGETTAKARGE